MKKFIGFNLSPLRLVLSAGITEKSLAQSSLLSTRWVIILIFSRFNSPISQPLLMRRRHWSFGPFLDSVWYVHVCSPELDAVLQTWSLQCWGQGKDPLPQPAGDAFPDAAQGTAGCLCHEGELLARGQLTGHPHHQVPFCKAGRYPAYTGPWDRSSSGAGLCTSLCWSSWDSCWPVSPTCWMTVHFSGTSATPSNFVSSVSLLKVRSVSPFRLLMKELNKICPSIDPWGTPIVTGLQLDSCHWWQYF